jgi:hypothetical protein
MTVASSRGCLTLAIRHFLMGAMPPSFPKGVYCVVSLSAKVIAICTERQPYTPAGHVPAQTATNRRACPRGPRTGLRTSNAALGRNVSPAMGPADGECIQPQLMGEATDIARPEAGAN